ncbi:peptidyl-prolyl cis-trans isomerase FKBP8-like [Saccostrea echinata]|uniref:peptidyl-prolyl cis-trans isomerase FKBP8-like n=1 Tax=Saccostrea echinata TaxID=191078 RepID=UPI002A7FFE01|nr:peptidyl-prolyl cis-trans isomerase FKBP8-like [Saccostrea echinata]
MESVSSQDDYGKERSTDNIIDGKSGENSILSGYGKDSENNTTNSSVASEGNINQNNSVQLDSVASKDSTSLSEGVSFSEDGKAEVTDQHSESSDQNEEDMPPLIDNENVTKDDNEKTYSEKETVNDQDKDINSSTQSTGNTDSHIESMNPDNVKENDVKDECLKENNEEERDNTKDEKKEEEEYLDILGNGSLKRKILKAAAPDGKRPMTSDVVTIKVEGKLKDETVVDVNESLTFVLGDGDVIQAWDLAVALMEEGQIIELQTEARFAYGEKGRKPDIPPNSSVTYIIELIKKGYPLDYDSMSATERLKYGEQKKERGNFLFTREDYMSAIHSYTKAVQILDPATCSDSAENLQKLLESRLKCYNNMAACQLKTNAHDAAIKSCLNVLDVQPENVKALFRTGKGHAAKGETKEGLMYMRKAQKLEPDTKVINQEIMKLSKKLQAESQSEKNMYQKMLGQKPQTKVSKPSQSSSSMWKWTSVIGGVTIAVVAMGITAYRHLQH